MYICIQMCINPFNDRRDEKREESCLIIRPDYNNYVSLELTEVTTGY